MAMRAASFLLSVLLVASSCGPPASTQPPEEAAAIVSNFEASRIEAVAHALEWLARNQEPDGRWDASRHEGRSTDVAVTGLAIIAFLGGGNTADRGKYSDSIRRGVQWLISQQDESGRIGKESDSTVLVNHPIAAWALAQSYSSCKSEAVGSAVAKALRYDGEALWDVRREGVRLGDPEPPLYLLPWYAMHLSTPSIFGPSPEVVKQARDEAEKLLFQRKDLLGPESVASGLCCRRWLKGLNQQDPVYNAAAKTLFQDTRQGHQWDCQGLYFANLALGGTQWWDEWSRTTLADLIAGQVTTGAQAGTWDPTGPGGDAGGRVLSTALSGLCLQWHWCGHVPEAWTGIKYDGPSHMLDIAEPGLPRREE
jgi:hypothetical protein